MAAEWVASPRRRPPGAHGRADYGRHFACDTARRAANYTSGRPLRACGRAGRTLSVAVVRERLGPFGPVCGPRLAAHPPMYAWAAAPAAPPVSAPGRPGLRTRCSPSYVLNPDRPGGHGLRPGARLCSMAQDADFGVARFGPPRRSRWPRSAADTRGRSCRGPTPTPTLAARPPGAALDQVAPLQAFRADRDAAHRGPPRPWELGGFQHRSRDARRAAARSRRRLNALGPRIWRAAGQPVHHRFAAQVADVLSGRLGLPPGHNGQNRLVADEADTGAFGAAAFGRALILDSVDTHKPTIDLH